MTATEQVKAAYPDAVCDEYHAGTKFIVWDGELPSHWIGKGDTEQAAWDSAAARIEQDKKDKI